MSGPSEEYVDVELVLPVEIQKELEEQVKIGILGDSVEEVLLFIIRQAMADRYVYNQRLKVAVNEIARDRGYVP